MPQEIANQNSVNADQERLNELRAEKEANQKILDSIREEASALKQEKHDFQVYKQKTEAEIQAQRDDLQREIESAHTGGLNPLAPRRS